MKSTEDISIVKPTKATRHDCVTSHIGYAMAEKSAHTKCYGAMGGKVDGVISIKMRM